MPTTIIDISKVRKTFKVGNQDVEILKDISFQIFDGDFLVIFGPSGCGKSTLLHIILGLEGPSTGNITFLGEDFYTGKNEDEISNFRKQHVGMVYQQANWIKSLKVGENVAFPMLLLGREKSDALEKAREILRTVNLEDWFDYAPSELSSGQQQRISLARALIHNPQVIIADEPTGNLDFKSGQEMMELLARLNQEHKKTVIMVTHDLEYLKFANRAVQMLDGKVLKIFGEDDKEELMKGLHFKRASEGEITTNLSVGGKETVKPKKSEPPSATSTELENTAPSVATPPIEEEKVESAAPIIDHPEPKKSLFNFVKQRFSDPKKNHGLEREEYEG